METKTEILRIFSENEQKELTINICIQRRSKGNHEACGGGQRGCRSGNHGGYSEA